MERSKIQGKKFGRLLVINYHSTSKKGKAKWLCRCDCGKHSVVQSGNLVSGHTQSCGCVRKHSPGYDSNGKQTRIYRIWSQMKDRCRNKKNDHFIYYGGKGVVVCEEWLDFAVFHEWAVTNGYSDDLTIDRINPSGNYEPKNCRWATRQEQMVNRSVKKGTGVNWEKRRNKWRARLSFKGKEVLSRNFDKYEDAVFAVEAARAKYHKEMQIK